MRKIILIVILFFSFIQAKSQTELIIGGVIHEGNYYKTNSGLLLGINYKKVSLIYSIANESYGENSLSRNRENKSYSLYWNILITKRLKTNLGMLVNLQTLNNTYNKFAIGWSIKEDYYLTPKVNINFMINYLFFRQNESYRKEEHLNSNLSFGIGLAYRFGEGYDYDAEQKKELENKKPKNKIKTY
jgi:hypothetical protein